MVERQFICYRIEEIYFSIGINLEENNQNIDTIGVKPQNRLKFVILMSIQ